MKFKLRRKPRRTIRRKRKSNALVKHETAISIPKYNLQMFPDRYFCRARINVVANVGVTGAASTYTRWTYQQIGNYVGQNNANVNDGGYATSNVPAGIYYLLGDTDKSSSHAGGNAPYAYVRTHGSGVKVKWLPDSTSSTQTTTQLVVLPTNGIGNVSYAGLVSNNVAEQPFAKTEIYPRGMITESKTINNYITTARMTGEKYKSSLESGKFDQSLNTEPDYVWQWVIYLGTAAYTATQYSINGTLMMEFYYDLEFFRRNTFITTVLA